MGILCGHLAILIGWSFGDLLHLVAQPLRFSEVSEYLLNDNKLNLSHRDLLAAIALALSGPRLRSPDKAPPHAYSKPPWHGTPRTSLALMTSLSRS